ncbi:hypothetical protein EYZ11_007883 [Aspergillus tanneri]|uniref:Uncharacterized protein n=1 Tax=Aspergillus tanneri TaxID=1220188 RepID=A0A4S3JBV6_9EURO|nr:hypothetical protein EYZ11_007883 [Aspergillus tanneri]
MPTAASASLFIFERATSVINITLEYSPRFITGEEDELNTTGAKGER